MYTAAHRLEAVRMRKEGKTLEQIATALETHPSTVRTWLREDLGKDYPNYLTRTGRKPDVERRAQLLELRSQGKSLKEIGKVMGIAYQNVSRMLGRINGKDE